jgi:hypothetical protein
MLANGAKTSLRTGVSVGNAGNPPFKPPNTSPVGKVPKTSVITACSASTKAPTSLRGSGEQVSGQGHLYEGKSILVFAQNTWHDAGFVLTGHDNGGDCDSPEYEMEGLCPCYSYTGTISVAEGSTSEFPDLLITRTGTINREHRGPIFPVETLPTF